MNLSARNQIHGKIFAVQKGQTNSRRWLPSYLLD
jgi:molybdopterin-binding protein